MIRKQGFRHFLAFGSGLFLSALALIVLAGMLSTRMSNRSAYHSTALSASIVAKSFAMSVRNAAYLAELANAGKLDEQQLANHRELLSVGTLKWNGEDFAYSRHFENSALKARAIESQNVVESLNAFRNEISSTGATQEQLYASLLGSDIPTLIVIVPLSESTSGVAILDAGEILGMLGNSREGETFIVDRSGTVLLHPEHLRGIHRESVATFPIVKRFFASPMQTENIQYADPNTQEEFLGTFSRISFAGAAAISQIPTSLIASSVAHLRETLIIGAALTALVAFLGLFCVLLFTLSKKKRGSEDQDRQTELRLVG